MHDHIHGLQIKDLTVSYNRVPALHHINMEVGCGHCVALLGPNGAGKTTFFKTIVGLLKPEAGSVTFHGHQTGRRLGHVAYLPQRENVDWDFPITVRGLVEMGCYLRLSWWRKFSGEDTKIVDSALKAMKLENLAERQISALSGGQQQRAFLARALAQDAHIFLFDEPFAGLDKQSQETLGQTIKEIAQKGNLVIASHHDLKNVPDFFDKVIFLNGELIAHGDTATVFNEENIAKTFSTSVFAGVAS
jgi:ABC-type Mn2+/Zn2+ transport system ATPase subunit